jgi:two-component system, NtrC family, sensor histidine kinase HydH
MRKAFDLTRWFLPFALGATAVVSVATSLLLSRLLVADMVQRDAVVSMEFVQSITAVEHPEDYFASENAVDTRLAGFFNHIATMPHVLRANVFSAQGRVIWSSDAKLIGMTFAHNPELEAALRGKLETSNEVRWKPEHMLLGVQEEGFVEHYLPVWIKGKVVGVVEVYKDQRALLESINERLRWVWLCSFAGGAVLFAILYWLVRRAQRISTALHSRQLECTTSAALAAMASAIAQGPLAAIRSRAELGLESASPASRDANEDILFEVERLQRWLGEVEAGAADDPAGAEHARLPAGLRDSLSTLGRTAPTTVEAAAAAPQGVPA